MSTTATVNAFIGGYITAFLTSSPNSQCYYLTKVPYTLLSRLSFSFFLRFNINLNNRVLPE